ncbi:MAG TPA: nitrilase-related carbon-nitrogen hydrolase [Ktedonobacteraceae bacterium]|jgi:predicted amidohydrolase|nr:nitrilase-related carbon-nitrogen hydrolase [Ktedonobacteraceae bacterium]
MSAPVPTYPRYRAAAIQFDPALGEKEQNIQALLGLAKEAAQNGAKLIVLPEMATTGYCWISREEVAPYVEPIPGPTTDRFSQLAATYDCYIAVSFPEVDPATSVYYNSMVLIGPKGLVGTYRKIHSYISEPRWARDGDLGFPVWDTPLGRLAGIICMDAEYFESARIPALHGADVLLFPTNWLEEKSPSSRWMARAFENGVYFIAANRAGCERGVQFSGGSCILNPDGSIQSYIDDGQGIVYGEIDLEQSRKKRWGSSWQNEGDRLADRRPEEYITLVHNTYLWEPLKYHSLYDMGELPPGQLSCVGFLQLDLHNFPLRASKETAIYHLTDLLRSTLRDLDPARPDVLVLPELLLPGPFPEEESSIDPVDYMREGAISVPGSETDALAALAAEYQLSLILGIAEKAEDGNYYNTVLLIDPEGVYGKYRKLHLTRNDRRWASPGNLGLPTFDTPWGRIGLTTGYDVLFPETVRVLAGKGADLVCAPAYLNFPDPIGLGPSRISYGFKVAPDDYDPTHSLLWRVRATEHQVYLALANWNGKAEGRAANGYSGIFPPANETYPWKEVLAEEEEDIFPATPSITMMTIDTREQRNGRRSTTHLRYAPGEISGSLTGELDYNVRDTIPGNVVRGKPLLRKRMPYWYLDLVRKSL